MGLWTQRLVLGVHGLVFGVPYVGVLRIRSAPLNFCNSHVELQAAQRLFGEWPCSFLWVRGP